jgi:hypothetical protein
LSRRSYIYWYPLLLVLAWIVAWLVNLDLRSAWHWGVTADTVYWIAMKFIVWLMLVGVLIVVVEKKNLADFLTPRRFWKGTVGPAGWYCDRGFGLSIGRPAERRRRCFF